MPPVRSVRRALGAACLLPILAGIPDARAADVELAVDQLVLPVRVTAPDGDPRLFVVEQGGLIRVFDQNGASRGTFLDIAAQVTSGGERGLLGLAFAPDYGQSGRFYVSYTNLDGDSELVRYLVDATDPDRADPASAELLLTIDQPFSNHNGGQLAFGPDGMLYHGVGDGGSGGDPGNNAQNRQVLLGKILRLDVSVPVGYAIPPDNPFAGHATTRGEIWALGLRNPWVFGFDRLTGDLYITDVGQLRREEIDVQPASSTGGENYGWRLMEGSLCYDPQTGCNDGTLVLPVYEYERGGTPFRCSISGGHVYRGALAPDLWGRYLFADYCSRQIWSLTWTAAGGLGEVVDRTFELTPREGYDRIVGIGQDGLGELYVIEHSRGQLFRIVGDGVSAVGPPAAARLEQNAPNPFNPSTTIAFSVPAGGATVRLDVLDLEGRLIRNLAAGERPEGRQTVAWDGRTDRGSPAAAGVYLYRLQVGDHVETRKMALVQ